MAGTVVKSGFAAKLGGKLTTAVAKHGGDETKVSGGDMPEGVQGIAQLVDIKFGVYGKDTKRAGEYFFYAAGVALAPKSIKSKDGVQIKIEGKRTSITEPMCETPEATGRKTLDEHVAWVLNQMRLLGLDTKGLKSGDQLEAAAAALKKKKPIFAFRTWKGEATKAFPNPRVNHTWEGVTDYTPEESDNVVDETAEHGATVEEHDDTTGTEAVDTGMTDSSWEDLIALADDDSDSEESKFAQVEINNRALAAGISEEDIGNTDNWEQVADLARATEGTEEGSEADAVDYDALGADADGDDGEEAILRLTAMAEEHGLDPNDAETYPSWTALAEAIKELDQGAAEEAIEAEEEWKPVVEEVYYYLPPGAKKKIECEVKAVFEAAKKVNLLNLDDAKSMYKSVPWDKLSSDAK